jgi:hypothetical protein
MLFTPFAGAGRRTIAPAVRPAATVSSLTRFRVGGFLHAFAPDRRAFASDTGACIAAAADIAATSASAQSPPAIKVESATPIVPESAPSKLYAQQTVCCWHSAVCSGLTRYSISY